MIKEKKKNNGANAGGDKEQEDIARNKKIFGLIAYPLIALFGLDLLANIFVISKKVILHALDQI